MSLSIRSAPRKFCSACRLLGSSRNFSTPEASEHTDASASDVENQVEDTSANEAVEKNNEQTGS